MPLIVRCPNPNCLKYNLVEDDRRGQTTECLVCGAEMRVEAAHVTPPPSPPGPRSSDAPGGQAGTPPAGGQSVIRVCPTCHTSLKIPATAQKQRVKCPVCQTISNP